ncbi:MAG: hypothetical protein KIT66_09920 [Chitinophagaceae bacterium]|nr:hypothetical protein [Chitinophagaceae bacterium]
MRNFILTAIVVVFCLKSFAQTQVTFLEHNSSKYNYKISVPSDFIKSTPKGANIDLKFVNKDGSNITVNVTQRLKDEYGITAHDYSKDMLQESFRANGEKTLITYSEKLIISGQNAFLIEFINAVPDLDLKMMQCYFFYKNLAFVITATSETKKFSSYRATFLKTIKSIKL